MHENCSTCKIFKNRIDGFLIVEGQSDIAFLSSLVDCEIVGVGGNAIPRGTSDYLVTLSKVRTPIIMTDPDSAGKAIEKRLLLLLPGAKTVHIAVPIGKRGKKGVAEADPGDVLEALSPYFSSSKRTETPPLSTSQLYSLGLMGERSSALRNKVSARLSIGGTSAKVFLHRVVTLGITYDKLKELVDEINGNH